MENWRKFTFLHPQWDDSTPDVYSETKSAARLHGLKVQRELICPAEDENDHVESEMRYQLGVERLCGEDEWLMRGDQFFSITVKHVLLKTENYVVTLLHFLVLYLKSLIWNHCVMEFYRIENTVVFSSAYIVTHNPLCESIVLFYN